MTDSRKTKTQLLAEVNSLKDQVAQLKQSEESSRKVRNNFRTSQKNLNTVFNLLSDMLFVVNTSGSICRTNPMVEEKLGYSDSDLTALLFIDICPPEFHETVLNAVQKGSSEANISLIHKNGKQLLVHAEIKRVEWDNDDSLLILARDITKTRRLEVELSMLSHTLRKVSECLTVFDFEGNIIFVNDTFLHTYGYSKSEIIGSSINKLHTPASEGRFIDEILPDTLNGGWNGELIAYRKSGENFAVELNASPVEDDAGKPIVIIGVFRDITERKQLENQLRQSQKMEAIGQLAGGIAHDFNNLLTVIEGYTELLFASTQESDPQQAYVKQIKKATDRATSLTAQLLAFSRRQILQPKVIDLNDHVEEMSVLLKRLIGEDVELNTILTPGIAQIKADPNQIAQVIMNLVVNSRDAMPGGGQLSIETSEVHFDNNYEKLHRGIKQGSYVRMMISDSGIGMDEEIQSRIFEPFFTTKEKGKGTGLGLATVYGIVKQSGGHIELKSAPGAGSSFEVYLPATESAKKVSAESDIASGIQAGNQTILVVEDEYLVRELVCDTLRSFGYKVFEASNGKQAIELYEAKKQNIDLVLTDVIMPGMSGRKMIEALVNRNPEISALYMSGYTDDAIISHGVLEPGMDYIQKPFSPKSLLKKLSEVLAKN